MNDTAKVTDLALDKAITDSILFVDDAPDLLLALQVMFRGRFDVQTANGAEDGLASIRRHGAYAVVVADMRMPMMNGAQFLAQVRELSPDSTRMLLTGNADMATAIEAVNQGNIFRFLTKPCNKQELTDAINAGVQQYRAHIAEKEKLESTQFGNIKLLTDVLRAANPAISAKSMRIARNRTAHQSAACTLLPQVELMRRQRFRNWAASPCRQNWCSRLTPVRVCRRKNRHSTTPILRWPQALLASIPIMRGRRLDHQSAVRRTISLQSPITPWRRLCIGGLRREDPEARCRHFDYYRMRMLTDQEALSRLRSRDQEFERPLVDLLGELSREKSGNGAAQCSRCPTRDRHGPRAGDPQSPRHVEDGQKARKSLLPLRIKLYGLVHRRHS